MLHARPGLQPDWVSGWFSYLLEWVHQEQAIIAGMLALCVGFLTVRAIQTQINEQREYWKDEKDRNLRAQRARLVFALSEFIDYNKICYQLCANVYERCDSITQDDQDSLEMPALPVNALEVSFTVLSQTLPDDVVSRLQSVLVDIQVYHSRLSGGVSTLRFTGKRIGGVNYRSAFVERAAESIYFDYLVGSLFDFARNEAIGASDLPTAERVTKITFVEKYE